MCHTLVYGLTVRRVARTRRKCRGVFIIITISALSAAKTVRWTARRHSNENDRERQSRVEQINLFSFLALRRRVTSVWRTRTARANPTYRRVSHSKTRFGRSASACCVISVRPPRKGRFPAVGSISVHVARYARCRGSVVYFIELVDFPHFARKNAQTSVFQIF